MSPIDAIVNKNPVKIQKRLREGAEVNERGAFDETPLIWATRDGMTKLVDLLLSRGADPNLQNEFGDTALMLASREGHGAIVQILLEHGADTSLKNVRGEIYLP